MANNQRQYATPIPTSGAPMLNYGTPIHQGTPLSRRLMPGANAGTPTSRASISGRIRAASVNVRELVGSYQHSQTQLYGSFLGSPSTRSHFPRRLRDEEESITSEDGDLTEGEWEDEDEEQDEEDEDDADEDRDQTDAYTSDPHGYFSRPHPASLSRSPGAPFNDHAPNGFSKTTAPGSLWEAAPTDLAPNWAALPVSFGLFMAGFVATLIYAIVGAGGYIMFGRDVSDEVSVDLMRTPGYNQTLNKVAVWMLVISPLALRAIERIVLALAVVLVAILFPAFGAVMAFLGAFSAFMLCVIGPICAKAALARRIGVVDGVLLAIAVVMAAAGTWVAFATGKGA
ncbi:hypothetical protein FRC06_004039 [Ceratobasidium sp. 370]|nr:hypothetical protein FRC06_004039 [Ceratobasidium sp. 370]